MKKALIAIAVVLVVVCGIGGYSFQLMAKKRLEAQANKTSNTAKVQRGDLVVTVVETGTVDAVKAVEVKSRVSGRLARLLVEEGDSVEQGQLIAVIDPQETELRVQQDEAQLRGAQSAVDRATLEIEQRRKTAKAAFDQARVRVAQLEMEADTQPTLTKAAIASAETALNTALEEKERLLKSAHPNQVTAADSAVAEALASFQNADRELKRQTDLEAKGYVSSRTLEGARLDYQLSKVRLDQARENRSKLDAQLSAERTKADEAIRQARADLNRAKANSIQDSIKREEYRSALAELEKARAALADPAIMAKQREQSAATVAQLSSVVSDSRRQLGETEIRAPISGVVTKKLLQVGELATGLSAFTSGTPIVKIEDRRTMRVKLDVNEIDVAKMDVGMPARIDVDAIPSRSFSGVVKRIAPASKDAGAQSQADAVVRYEVEIEFLDPGNQLRSGMSAQCSVDVVKHTDVLTLPVEFVLKEGRDSFIFPQAAKGAKPEKKEIEVGSASGSKIEILSGVSEGQVVTRPERDVPDRKGMMQAGPDEE